MSDVPIACTLSPDALKTRREGLLAGLFQRAEHHELTELGIRMRFAPATDVVAAIARVVDAERQCCRFLRFAISVEPDGGPILLELTGPPGTREFLAGLVDM
jgi:hypothetical protein